MTPKEKALELVAKYSRVLPMNQTTLLDHKNCALIAVEEMKESLFDADLMQMWDYWFEVKKEIQKL